MSYRFGTPVAAAAWKRYDQQMAHYREAKEEQKAYGCYDDGKRPGYAYSMFEGDYVVQPREPDEPKVARPTVKLSATDYFEP